jgi:Mannose-6-phosphate isomerase
MINLTHYDEAPRVDFAFDGRRMYTSADLEIIHLRLKPGEKLEKHTNKFITIFYVLDGTSLLITDQKPLQLKPNDSIEVAAHTERCLFNNSVHDFRVLVIKKLKGA